MAGIPLRITAKMSQTDRTYFDSIIPPMIAEGGVETIGEISDAVKPAFLSGAIGLLMAVDWPEPFGPMMIEARACGTPVIAFNHGSVSEIIENSPTGFIVANEDEAFLAVSQLPRISRRMVRHRFERRFTARCMAEDYVDVYRNLVAAPTDVRDSKPAHMKVSPARGRRLGGGAAAQRANASVIPHLSPGTNSWPAAYSPITSVPLSEGITDADGEGLFR